MERVVVMQPQKNDRFFVLFFMLGHSIKWILKKQKDMICIFGSGD